MSETKPSFAVIAAERSSWSAAVGDITSDVCGVRVLKLPDLRPAVKTVLVFQVVSGPLFFKGGRRRLRVVTDRRGHAAVEAQFRTSGSAVVWARIAGARDSGVRLIVHSVDTTESVIVNAPHMARAGEKFEVSVRCRNHVGQAANRARVKQVAANRPIDLVESFRLKRSVSGRYSNSIHFERAGIWTLNATEEQSGITASKTIAITPGEPSRFRIVGSVDPRAEAPFDRVLVRARLEDRYGNAIDPERVKATIDGVPTDTRVVAQEAQVLVWSEGSGSLSVDFVDSVSGLTHSVPVWFAPAWMAGPIWIPVSSDFATSLYLGPRSDVSLKRATVLVDFDPRMVSLSSFEPSSDSVNVSAEKTSSRLRVIVRAELPGTEISGNGIGLLVCHWSCKRKGPTKFQVRAKMSPTERGWMYCPEQKRADPLCICVNIIWRQGQEHAGTRGVKGAYRFGELVSEQRNVGACCPILKVNVVSSKVGTDDFKIIKRYMNTSLNNYDFQWNFKFPATEGTGSIETDALLSALTSAGLWRTDCFNVVMIPFPPGAGGTIGFKDPFTGVVVVDPDRMGDDPNIIAHELGHLAGGLEDRHDDSGLLMHDTVPPGELLTQEECKKLWKSLGNYRCDKK